LKFLSKKELTYYENSIYEDFARELIIFRIVAFKEKKFNFYFTQRKRENNN